MSLTCVQEGELRPQLLDRFGMSVNVTTLLDVDVRTQMVLDKMAYEQVRLPCIADCQFVGQCITCCTFAKSGCICTAVHNCIEI